MDLTLCWMCGVEIVCAESEQHGEWAHVKLWRPLTDAEKLVKHETTRQLRDLFHRVHPSEYSRILFERLETKNMPAIRLAETIMGRWIIVNGQSEDLAWSGSRWVPHNHGIPIGGVQVSNFTTREEAAQYAEEQFPDKTSDPGPTTENY